MHVSIEATHNSHMPCTLSADALYAAILRAVFVFILLAYMAKKNETNAIATNKTEYIDERWYCFASKNICIRLKPKKQIVAEHQNISNE